MVCGEERERERERERETERLRDKERGLQIIRWLEKVYDTKEQKQA